MIEPSLALYGESYNKVSEILDSLLKKANVRYVLLVDRKGFVLAHKQALWAPKAPALDSISTLIAGNAAATSALAKILGEPKFNELVHQGEKIGLYVEDVTNEALLAVVFDDQAPIGRVKLFSKQAIKEMSEIIRNLEPMEKIDLGADFAAGASSLLDDIFGP